jgi:hypothetical protein
MVLKNLAVITKNLKVGAPSANNARGVGEGDLLGSLNGAVVGRFSEKMK